METITFGICGWCLDVTGVKAVKRAHELGFDTMQIGVQNIDEVNRLQNPVTQTRYREAVVTHHMNIIGLSLSVFDVISLHDATNAIQVWDILRGMIDTAIAMNIDLVFIPSFNVSQITTADEMTHTADMFRRACDYIGDRRLELATENTLDVAGHRDLLNQVNHPKLKVLVDSYNPIVFGASATDQIRELRDVLANQAHAKDGINHVMGSALLGQGEGDFLKTVDALKEIDFNGYIICENNYDVDTEARIQADRETLQHVFST